VAARFCTHCGLKYDTSVYHCVTCGRSTHLDHAATPATVADGMEVQQTIEAMLEEERAKGPEGTLRAMRTSRLCKAGLSWDRAVVLADTRLDIHEFENLVKAGATPEQADRILS